MRYLRIGCAVAALIAPMAVQAQETTASLRGQVSDLSGNPVAGARVTVTHVPSGTRSVQVSDGSGSFNATGLRLGGPVKVDVLADGYDEATAEVGFLTAGVPQRINVVMAEAGQTITVTAGRVVRSAITLASGPATVLNARDIAGISNVNRDIRNLAARDPLVTIDPGNRGAISIAGQNNRFNRFTVDGLAFGDPFGLEASGLVSPRGPVPLDAIGEFSVEVAPVDIQQGFFQGGAINTQLKSGGNDFTFLGGFYYSADSLRGKTARGVDFGGDFSSEIFTAQATGPIIKDKLFFAVTYERTRDAVPSPISPTELGFTDAQISQIQGIGSSVYNFDTLGAADGISEADDKLVAKIDWNVTDGHRVAFTYIYNKGNRADGLTGTNQLNAANPTFALQSNNFNSGAVNHFGVVQFNDQWTDNFSTVLRGSYADYERLQVPFGDASFGQFQTCLEPVATVPAGARDPQLSCPSGVRRLNFGPDAFRQANQLRSKSFNVEFQATLKMNNHSVKAIVERRTQDINNLFAARTSGTWYFDSVADLQAQRANELVIAVPLRGGLDTVAAIFENNTWTFGLQDTVDVSDNLTVTAGFRWDFFDSPDRPFFNEDFLNRFGFPNNSTLNGRQLFQPRFGINWKASDRLSLRGSAGLYGGGSPNVWISNSYSVPGPTLGQVTVRRVPGADGAADTFTLNGLSGLSAAQAQALGAQTLNGVTGGTGVPQTLIAAAQGGGAANAATNSLDPNFQPPSQWRVAGSVEYAANLGALGDEWNLGADVIWSRVKNGLVWTDIRSVPTGQLLPDGRPRYANLLGEAGDNTDILLTNTNQGYSWNIVARFDKRWDTGFRLGGSYTLQRNKDASAGGSSQAQSIYERTASDDPNTASYGTSNYQRDDAYRLVVGYDSKLFGDNITRFELFFNSLSGQRFSHTFTDANNARGRGELFGVTRNGDGRARSRFNMYVPDVSSISADPLVTYAPGFDFAAFQTFVQEGVLGKFQGEIAPKNIGRAPRYNKLDLSIRQELPFVLGGRIELLADMENVLNFINSDWGTIRQIGFPYFGRTVDAACANAACTQYVYSNFNEPRTAVNPIGSLWGIRVGARVKF